MSPSTIIVEVMEEFSGSNRWDVNFSILISHFYLQHPWAGVRDRAGIELKGPCSTSTPAPNLFVFQMCRVSFSFSEGMNFFTCC